jgi:hypothetical protein
MRDSLRALLVSGAFMVAAGVAPEMAQSADATAADTSAPVAGTPVSSEDIKKAASQIRSASRSYGPCERASQCSAYFETFGVALTFSDGTMTPFAHEQRLKLSGHACIQNARDALLRGDRALAVQWVMAAHMDDPLMRNWLGDHPDAVLEGLRHFGS